MKIKLSVCALSLLLAFNAIGEPLTSVSLEAKIEGKTTYARGKSESITQTRKIEATITDTSEKPMDGTVVKWAIYGHEMKDHRKPKMQSSLNGEGEKSVQADDNSRFRRRLLQICCGSVC